jgi:acyl carrier protein
MFNYRPVRGVTGDGLITAGVEANIGYTRLDLQVSAFAVDGQIEMAALYSDELFDREDIVALLDRMDLLIRVCAEMPDMSLADLAMLAAPASREAAQEPADATAVVAPAVTDGVFAAEQELSELLVGLWREILRSPELDTDAHFFRSGGTSLRAAQLVARVKSKTGVKLSLRNVFRAPTPRQLAHAMAAAGQAG